jgi:tetratricopeptide (TPR) repeat protein
MGTPGYVYALINQSLPNCVKIGKTTKDPSSRATELSSATGVPTPFCVAYEAYFNDCDAAEEYIHAFFESRGVRLSTNREFFSVSSTVAINAICEAQTRLGAGRSNNTITDIGNKPYEDELLSELTISQEESVQEPWESVLEEAENYDYGYGDYLEDHDEAIKLYKNAAKLGSSKAHIRLAELIADSQGDMDQGIEWLKRGADRGLPDCWLELAKVFCGDNIFFIEVPRSKDNAIKCYRKYLGFVDSPHVLKENCQILNDNRGFDKMFFAFRSYLQLVGASPEQRDIEVSKVFVNKFRNTLMNIENQDEAIDKTKQFDLLVSKHMPT